MVNMVNKLQNYLIRFLKKTGSLNLVYSIELLYLFKSKLYLRLIIFIECPDY